MNDEKLLKRITAGSVFLLCFVLVLSVISDKAKAGPAEQTVQEDWTRQHEQEVTPVPTPVPTSPTEIRPTSGPTPSPTVPPKTELPGVWKKVKGAEKSGLTFDLVSHTIVLEKKAGYENAVFSWSEDPVYRQLRLVFSGVEGDRISDEQVQRISEDQYFCGTPPSPTPTPTPTPTPRITVAPVHLAELSPTPTLSPDDPFYPWQKDLVRAIEYSEETDENGKLIQTILLTLDKTYVYRVYEDSWNYYISLIRPKDVYDKIIVVDAGHGGVDPGACSYRNEYREANINLDVVLYLKEMMDAQEEIKVYYTRTTDTRPNQMQRVTLANDVEADFLVSIHCNSNKAKSLNGTEVLYNSMQNKWTGMNSRSFSKLCLEEMCEHLGRKNNGIVARDHDVTVVKEARMPVALIEMAYISNESDLKVLAQEESRRAAAEGIYHAILRAYEEMNGEEE